MKTASVAGFRERVAAVRRFNRFYTNRIGVLQKGLLKSRYSLTEARVLFELAQRDECTATDLARQLDIDSGYLSRILRSFEEDGMLRRNRSDEDGRQRMLILTRMGRLEFADLNGRSETEIGAILAALHEKDQRRLVGAMETIETLLGFESGGA